MWENLLKQFEEPEFVFFLNFQANSRVVPFVEQLRMLTMKPPCRIREEEDMMGDGLEADLGE